MDILPAIASDVYFHFEDIDLYLEYKKAMAARNIVIHYRFLEAFLQSEGVLEAGIHVVCMREVGADSVSSIGQLAGNNRRVRVVLVVSQIASRLVASAFNSGIADVLVESVDSDRLLDSLNVVDLELFAATEKAQRIAGACAKLELLSPREMCVLNGILGGKQNKQIAGNRPIVTAA